MIKFLFYIAMPALILYSCQKENSYGEGNAPAVIPPEDTVDIGADSMASCSICSNSSGIQEGTWAFHANNSVLCGEVDTAYILNFSSFTFSGPSACSADTGLLCTVYMSGVSFDRSFDNASAASATFSYSHSGFSYIVYSQLSQPFTFTITSYNHNTHIATGTFSGPGFRQDGRTVNITNGKFTITLL